MSTAQLKQTSVGVSSPYGWRVLKKTGQRNLHKGTDFPFGKSTGVSAFGSGTVVFAGRGTGANAERGLYVQIKHADGIETSYHSLSKITVKVGQHVNMGDIIGYGGMTAQGASGNHVHVGLWLNGSHVNLENYLTPGKVVTVSNTGQILGNDVKPIPNTPTSTPATPVVERTEDMFTHWDTSGTGWFVNNNAWVAVDSPQHMALLRRMISGKEDTFLRAEVDIMNSYLTKSYDLANKGALTTLRADLDYLHIGSGDSLKAIHADVKKSGGVDSSAIAKAVTDAVKAQVEGLDVKVDIDYDKIASVVTKLQGEAFTSAAQ